MLGNRPTITKLSDLDKTFDDTIKIYGEYFDKQVKDLNIDLAKNKEWSTKYYKLKSQIEKLNKSIRTKKIWRWFLIIFLIFPFVLLTKQANKQQEIVDGLVPEFDKHKELLDKQLAPLHSRFSSNDICTNVLSKAMPSYEFSETIPMDESSIWDGIDERFIANNEHCLTNLFTGKMYQNPFLLTTRKEQSWIEVPYSASATISYTNSKGERDTEVVTATVWWPFPVYKYNHYLIVKTNNCPTLEFSNSNSLKNSRKIKKFYKGSSAERMDNEMFDTKFPCERNDELMFRLYFTVLTQENFVNLINEIGSFKMWKSGNFMYVYNSIGDFSKPKNIKKFNNVMYPNKNINYSFNCWYPDDSYDLEKLKEQKSERIGEFARSFASMQLPIANMPIIVREYYKETAKSNPKATSVLQDQVFAYDSFMTDFSSVKKYHTPAIIECEKGNVEHYGETNIMFNKVTSNYFVPVPKVIPKLAVGVHGSRWVNVIVQDFIPHTEYFYLVQINNLNKSKDLSFEGGGKVINGVFYKLFNFKPTQKDIEKLLQALESNF